MRGTTHKAIGTVVGVSIVVYAIKSEQPMLALGAVTAPFGAMLPDIDHDRSKLGAQRKVVMATINKLIGIAFVAVILLALVVGLVYGTATLLLFKETLITVPICGVCLIANSDKMRRKYKFLHKHRGIMHTLLIPALLVIGVYTVDIDWLSSLLLGLALGYLSHLYADCLTVSGCPIAWPISEECFRLTRITTGTFWEYVGASCLSACIGFTGLVLSSEYIRWLWVWAIPLAFAIGSVAAGRVLDRMPKLKKKKLLLCLVPTVVIGIACPCTKKLEFSVLLISVLIAYLLRILKLCKK